MALISRFYPRLIVATHITRRSRKNSIYKTLFFFLIVSATFVIIRNVNVNISETPTHTKENPTISNCVMFQQNRIKGFYLRTIYKVVSENLMYLSIDEQIICNIHRIIFYKTSVNTQKVIYAYYIIYVLGIIRHQTNKTYWTSVRRKTQKRQKRK